jgi:hypothetical protein
MISQWSIYLACFILGWAPLYWGYRFLERRLPFSMVPSKTRFSYLAFLKLGYLLLEFLRGVAIMVMIHDWLLFDYDLLLGVFLWLVAISWPPFVPKHRRTPLWMVFSGVFYYLFPWFFVLFPTTLMGLCLVGVPSVWRYFTVTVIFLVVGIMAGSNSLYVLLYGSFSAFIWVRHAIELRSNPYSLSDTSH